MMILKTIFLQSGLKLLGRKLKDYKVHFEEEEWDDVITIIENVGVYESRYNTSSEQDMDKIRDDVVIEINKTILEE